MVYHVARYFCPDRNCTKHNLLLFDQGKCAACGKTLERVRYCPDCETMGTPAQNRICYKCKKYLVDVFNVPALKDYPGPENKKPQA